MARTSKNKEDNKYIMMENKNDVVNLENNFVNSQLSIANLNHLVEERKEEVVNKLVEFQNNYVEHTYDKYGNDKKTVNPYLISTYFFKSINPMSNTEPTYSSEKLAIVWDIYMYLIEQVNMNIAPFQPTLTHFAKFAGISLTTLRNYRNMGDAQMNILIDKIYDETMDSNLTLAQNNKLKERTTAFRLKVENEVVEKVTPKVNVNVSAKLDLNKINTRLDELTNFNKKLKNKE
jgi:hypothetical protein